MHETLQMIAGVVVMCIIIGPPAVIMLAGIIHAIGAKKTFPIIVFCGISAVAGFAYWLIKADQDASPTPPPVVESSPDDCERYPGPYGC